MVAPVIVGLLIIGEVNVLFVNVSMLFNVDKVPLVGNVTLVVPVVLKLLSPCILKMALYGPTVPKVLAESNLNVAVNADGCCKIILLIVFAVEVPKFARTNVGCTIVGLFRVGVVSVLFIKVSTPANVESVPVNGRDIFVSPVLFKTVEPAIFIVNGYEPVVVNVLCSPNVKVARVAGWVKTKLFIVVAVAIPKVGDVRIGAVSLLFVSVSVLFRVASVPVVGTVTFVAPLNVNVEEYAPAVLNELLFARANVAVFDGAEIIILLIVVAIASPRFGLESKGAENDLFNKTWAPSAVTNVPDVAGSNNVVFA